MRDPYDVVVAGAGNAGLCAAVAAAERGASVALLEKSSHALRGGNTRLTGGLLRCSYGDASNLGELLREDMNEARLNIPPYRDSDFVRDLEITSEGRTDPALSRVLARQSWPTIQWMVSNGVRFHLNRGLGSITDPVTGVMSIPEGSVVRAEGHGAGLSESLFSTVEKVGVTIRYEAEAQQVSVDDKGAVDAVIARSRDGLERLKCRSFVIASGGFEANSRMRCAYLGPEWSKVIVRGVPFNTGICIDAAINVGAQPYGDWGACHATIVDAEAPQYGNPVVADDTGRLSYRFGLMFNLDGNRFVDEGEDYHQFTYAKYGRELLRQRHQLAIQVFDAKTLGYLDSHYSQWPGHPIRSDTIDGLVRALAKRLDGLSFQPDQMLATIASFNDAVVPGAFDPAALDGTHTDGLVINKANWALPLVSPPYIAYIVTCGITFTYGGIRINEQAEAMDFGGRPISGLFAAGEAVGGLFYGNYPGGAGLTSGAVFGRLAGVGAAEYATKAGSSRAL